MYDLQREGERLLSSIDTACRRLDLGRTSIYGLVKTGELELVKIGSKSFIPEKSIRSFIDRLAQPTATEEAA